MSTERYYRGGSRSPFRTSFTNGNISPRSSRDYVALIAPGTAQDSRIKRVQVIMMVPKSSTTATGWLGFLRVPDQGTIETSSLDIDAPSVLRPKVWINNPDHAIYVEVYLEAINLAAGEVLGILAYADGTIPSKWAAKWYGESELH